ncbi:TRAP transporter small permease subunit [Rhizobium sp. RU36D]|uniref:TRAP transporter small permease n=1 Tax=Rhizobium sp. RU36D TaxID=1907415 RepID=UPI0009D813DB|nr:TRAP transporter small permease subunit [Rhizobium sp. RU36D]SMD12678.1 TRAP-type C4-dicarboxylate transport system, small permease component [Rhizobium sp. RU36D]
MSLISSMLTAGRWIRVTCEAVTTALFGLVVVAFAYGVTSRYIFGVPSRNADEIAVILFLWVIMFGAGLAVAPSEHISVDLVTARLKGRANRLTVGLGSLVAAAIFLYALPTTLDYVMFLRREVTPAMRLPLSFTYFCFVLFQGAAGMALLARGILVLSGFQSTKAGLSASEEAL